MQLQLHIFGISSVCIPENANTPLGFNPNPLQHSVCSHQSSVSINCVAWSSITDGSRRQYKVKLQKSSEIQDEQRGHRPLFARHIRHRAFETRESSMQRPTWQ